MSSLIQLFCILLLCISNGLQAQKPQLTMQTGHGAEVNQVAFTPDGTILITCDEYHTIKMWEVKTKKLLRTIQGHHRPITSLAIASNGRYFLTGADDQTVRLWQVKTGKLVKVFKGNQEYSSILSSTTVAFSPNGKSFAIGYEDGKIEVRGTRGRYKIIDTLSVPPSASIASLAISPNGKQILVGTYSFAGRYYIRSGKELQTFELPAYRMNDYRVAFSPDGQHFAVARSEYVEIRNSQTGTLLHKLEDKDNYKYVLRFSPNGRYLAACGGGVFVWDVKTGQQSYKLESASYGNGLHAIAFSPDGTQLVTGDVDHSIRFWNAKVNSVKGTLLHTIAGADTYPESVAISPKDERLLIGTWKNQTKVWDFKAGGLTHLLKTKAKVVTMVTVSPDGQHLVTGYGSNFDVWNAQSGQRINRFFAEQMYLYYGTTGLIHRYPAWINAQGWPGERPSTFRANSVEISHNLQYLLIGSGRRYAELWSLISKKRLHLF